MYQNHSTRSTRTGRKISSSTVFSKSVLELYATDFRSYFISFDDGARLEIMTKPALEDPDKPLNRTGYAHIAFSVGSKEEVDRLTERLKYDGFEVVSGPSPYYGRWVL